MRFYAPDGSVTADFPACMTLYYKEKGFHQYIDRSDPRAEYDTPYCHAVTLKGKPCSVPPVHGSDYCFAHQPKKDVSE